MMRTIPLLAGTLALVTGFLTVEVNAAEVKVLSAGAMRGILQELAPAFETASGHKLKIDYATAGVVEQKVAADDEIDVAILTKPRIDKLVREAKIVGGTTKTLASAQIGLAVKKGATKPDISSVEAFKRALLNAKSVAYADRLPALPAGPTWRRPSKSWVSPLSSSQKRGSSRPAPRRARGSEKRWRAVRRRSAYSRSASCSRSRASTSSGPCPPSCRVLIWSMSPVPRMYPSNLSRQKP
jgi:hypothetical protein